jgi:hypothetical protein
MSVVQEFTKGSFEFVISKCAILNVGFEKRKFLKTQLSV